MDLEAVLIAGKGGHLFSSHCVGTRGRLRRRRGATFDGVSISDREKSECHLF